MSFMFFFYNVFMFDTIAAISSGYVNQPISVIRLSGPDAFAITKKIFSGKVGTDKTITYGWIKDGEAKVDEVLALWFKGPNTFTGEDVVEINAHGGVVNTQRILRLLLANGARMAENGEFSRRAFLHGKMDLIKAEAIHDLIFANTEDQANLSVKKFDGETSSLIKNLLDELLTIIATLETNIDYPEYDDVEQITDLKMLAKLTSIKTQLEDIKESSKQSRYIFEGVNVAIVGKPNAGKSSLLNALLNEDKAIVSSTPGTTRDIVEGRMQLGQVLLNFKDTAGIRDSGDDIELKGITKALTQIKDADLILHVIDVHSTQDMNDALIEKTSINKPYIKIFNKTESKSIDGAVNIVAKDAKLSELLAKIKSIYKTIDLDNSKVLNNARQLALIESSLIAINDAITAINNGITSDTIIVDVRQAWEDLANILGQSNQDDLLDHMFKNFCLGK